MQFKHPELLYGLLLLLIPIIVHLFQLRKFQKEAFTNVAFLKEITLQTRKSSKIKKWLILSTRLALIAAIVLSFAQPFTAKNKNFANTTETVIYLDNSFSLQAKGNQGPLLKRAIQDLINHIPEKESFTLITNNNTYSNTTIKAITNELLQLDYASEQLSYDAALLKCKKYFSKDPSSIKNLVFISDFQQKAQVFKGTSDENTNLNLVQLRPISSNNIAIDSVFIANQTATNFELAVQLKNSGDSIENLPVSLYSNGNLLAKSSVSINDDVQTVFSLPANTVLNAKLEISDPHLQFDNSFYFNINTPSQINVLAISDGPFSYLKRIYNAQEFNFKQSKLDQLNYSALSDQNLIVLNELTQIPNALITALRAFTNDGGILAVIPSEKSNLQSYNSLLLNFNFKPFQKQLLLEKRLTTINYAHTLFRDGVFEKRVSNFQFPKVQSFYNQALGSAAAVLQFEDKKPFLSQKGNVFVFTAALNTKNTNFQEINLIVPTFYNMGKLSLQKPRLYYTIGKENTYDVSVALQQDQILNLVNSDTQVIPQQQYFKNKVLINTSDTPDKAGIYDIKNKAETLEKVSYNYNREESFLSYQDLSGLENIRLNATISELFDSIKSDTKVNALWKWFVIFALILLIIEMLILKYFK